MAARSTRRRGAGGGGGAAGAGGSSGATAVGGHPSEEVLGQPENDGDDADAAPSELLAPLLEEWRDVLAKHVLSQLDATDCALLARVAKPWLAVVLANNLPRAGKDGAVVLKVKDFVGSAEMLAWAKDNGCPWEEETCAQIAAGGRLEVLQWAVESDCQWNMETCARQAARGGHLEVLQWAREQGCLWGWRHRLTLVHFSAHRKCFLWDRGCMQGVFRRSSGVRGEFRVYTFPETAQVELKSSRV